MGISVRKAQYSILHLQRLVEQRQEIRLDALDCVDAADRLDASERLDVLEHQDWTNQQQIAFLETILLGIPVPAIYLQETKEGVYRIIDGYNRIATILKFLQHEVVLDHVLFLSKAEGKRFQELEASLKGAFEDYQLTFYVLPVEVEEELVLELRRRL